MQCVSPFPPPHLSLPSTLFTADIHFSSKPFTVTFAPSEVEKCVGIDILLNADSDTDLVFIVSLSPKRPVNVMNASVFIGDDTTVVITEASECVGT